MLCHADYDFEGRSIHLVMASTPIADVRAVGAAIAHHLAEWIRTATRSSTS